MEAGAAASAFVVSPAREPLDWTLADAAGARVARGRARPFGDDAASGERLQRVELPPLAPGVGYTLRVGADVSRPFAASARPFAAPARDAMGFFYQQRSGIPIEAAYVQRADLARAAGHAPDRATCFAGVDMDGKRWPGCAYTLDASRGWYDAGDHGKYVVNGGMAAWTLLAAYEHGARAGAAPFADGSLRVPEHANGVDDLLDEARWELDFLLAMQVPDGARFGFPDRRMIDAVGLVHHKIADEHWTHIPLAPADDRERRFLYPPTTAATLNLAAVAAQAARIWRAVDPAFATRCLAAARRAWAAAERYPALRAVNNPGSGGYEDDDTTDERLWAAAELFATTREAAFAAVVAASPRLDRPRDLAWAETEAAAVATLAFGPASPARGRARAALLRLAHGYMAERARSGYALPDAGTAYEWGSNSVMLNRALVLGLAHELTGEARYRAAARDAVDYVFGRNALDRSYVTGYGARAAMNPHHRFWAHQKDARFPYPPSGALVGGPNSMSRGAAADGASNEPCAPAKCWHDDHRLFTQNEVAVNWNAPLVWVLSYLDETRPRMETRQ